ncbi:MAG: GFA family protein [Pseudomonadota bacterium]
MEGCCTCGSVTYELTQSPLFVHCCHCLWCQRESGSAFAINVLIESKHLRVNTGNVVEVDLPSESGNGQTMVRCAICQVALWSHYAGMGKKVAFVRAGTLTKPDQVSPDIHIFTESKQAWVEAPEDVPAVPRYYRRSETWPKSSQDRWQQLKSS